MFFVQICVINSGQDYQLVLINILTKLVADIQEMRRESHITLMFHKFSPVLFCVVSPYQSDRAVCLLKQGFPWTYNRRLNITLSSYSP